MDVATNDDSHGIFMGDSWFTSVPTEQSIRRDGRIFKGIAKKAHNILPKAEIKI